MFYRLVLILLYSIQAHSSSSIFSKVESDYRLSAPEYLNSQIELHKTRADLYSSIADHLPELSFTLGQKRLNEQTGVPPSNYLNSNRRTERSWELDLVFPIFDRSKYLSIEKSLVTKKAAIDSHGYLTDQIDWKLKSSLGGIYIQLYKIINLEKSIIHFGEILKAQEEGYRLKAKRVIDVEEARSNLELLKARKTIEENLLSSNKVQLAILLGKSSLYVDELLKDLPQQKEKIFSSLEEHYELEKILAKKLNTKIRREAIEAVTNNFKVEKINSKFAQSTHWPTVEVVGTYSKEGPSWKDIKDFDNSNRTIGIYLRVPIFQSGKAFSDNHSVNALVSQSINRRRYGARQIVENGKNTRLQFEREKVRLKILTDHLNSRKRLLKAYREAFRLGKETLNELIKQENNYIESEFALIDSMNNLGSLYYQCAYLYGVSG